MTSIGDICNREVITTAADTSVLAAAQLLRRHHVGSIVICDQLDGNRCIPLGIVTDRDIVVEVVAPEARADVITVGDIMGRDLVTARESDSVVQTLDAMRFKGVRRMPIVNGDGQLVGIVAIDDLLGYVADELNDIAKTIARERAREAATRK